MHLERTKYRALSLFHIIYRMTDDPYYSQADSFPMPLLLDVMRKLLSRVRLFAILQARILEWAAFPSPGDFPNPGIEPWSPT